MIPYELREEQNDAVTKTLEFFSTTEKGEFLWNAKPRFGKTLATYDLFKRMQSKNNLIVTNRPAIANSWYDDYEKFLGTESGYYFVSNVDALKNKKSVWPLEKFMQINASEGAKNCIMFVSLQDLKGANGFGGKYDKLSEIQKIEWDMLVIDEAHEGVDTTKTDRAIEKIEWKNALHLSGTPFKALTRKKFPVQAIYNWTYADEQERKRTWDNSHDEENPYLDLPRLNLYTYKMSDIVFEQVKKGADFNNDGKNEAWYFDLNEFFKTQDGGGFIHDHEVNKLLDALTSEDKEKFPFSTPELRNELDHTLWILPPRVKIAELLAKKLKNHPVFKDYGIVVAAGGGKVEEDEGDITDDAANAKAYDLVVQAIAKYQKTITLSVGQLTTGITIPEWKAVLMLSSTESPEKYMQAAFRAQNPYKFTADDGQHWRKENAYVFDFDPTRSLEFVEKFANNLIVESVGVYGDFDARKNNIRKLLNFFPVYGEDESGKMVELDAEEVLSIPNTPRSNEVVNECFMSNYLFSDDIANLFSTHHELQHIISKLKPDKQNVKKSVAINDETKTTLSSGDNADVTLAKEAIVVGKHKDAFGEKIVLHQKFFSDKLTELEHDLQWVKDSNEEKSKKLTTLINNLIAEQLKDVKDADSKKLPVATVKSIAKKLYAQNTQPINELLDNYFTADQKLNIDKQKEIEAAHTEGNVSSIPDINARYDQEANKNLRALFKNIEAMNIVENNASVIAEEIQKENQSTHENKIREQLRGFARTIPLFLMAYGSESTTLENIDKTIPEHVFEDVAGITLEEFRKLRDGFNVNDDHGKPISHQGCFNVVVFNNAIKAFFKRKNELANYFMNDSDANIFDYIPPQRNNQIFTPKKVVKDMIKYLKEQNPGCFDNPNHTFIDLYVKSGLYIAEIVKRLFRSPKLKELYPNDDDRLSHIFAKQVYGLAPNEIIYNVAHNFLLGFDKDKKISRHNLKLLDALPYAKEGTLERKLDEVFPNQK